MPVQGDEEGLLSEISHMVKCSDFKPTMLQASHCKRMQHIRPAAALLHMTSMGIASAYDKFV
jgi:hypothetical protein